MVIILTYSRELIVDRLESKITAENQLLVL